MGDDFIDESDLPTDCPVLELVGTELLDVKTSCLPGDDPNHASISVDSLQGGGNAAAAVAAAVASPSPVEEVYDDDDPDIQQLLGQLGSVKPVRKKIRIVPMLPKRKNTPNGWENCSFS